MKTYEIVHEGIPTSDGRLIIDDAVTWDDEPIPLLMRGGEYDPGQWQIGWIENVRRQGHCILGDVEVELEKESALGADMWQLEGTVDDEFFVIRSCKLVAATVIPAIRFAWKDVTEE